MFCYFFEKTKPDELLFEVQSATFSITTPDSYRDFSTLVE